MYPWAVAVWTLYPLAMIEVVCDLNLEQESLDNDLIRMILPELFTTKYFNIYPPVVGVAPVDMFPRTPCAYMVYMDASFVPFGRDFLNTHVAALTKDPRPILYWYSDKLAIAVMHARPYVKLVHDEEGGNKVYVETSFTARPLRDSAAYEDLLALCDVVEPIQREYFFKDQLGGFFYQEDVEELKKNNPPLPSAPCDDSNSHVTVAVAIDVSDSVLLNQPFERVYSASNLRCEPPENLIIDAIYVPMPQVGDNSGSSAEPTFWLTSSLSPITFSQVFDTFTEPQIKTIVQHLDPILQNANMQKILSFIPSDISDALRLFDAYHYPEVISLRDVEYPHWGETCP